MVKEMWLLAVNDAKDPLNGLFMCTAHQRRAVAFREFANLPGVEKASPSKFTINFVGGHSIRMVLEDQDVRGCQIDRTYFEENAIPIETPAWETFLK